MNQTTNNSAPILVVQAEEGGRKLLSFLSLRLQDMPGCNASVLQKWIRSGQVRVNSGRSKPFARLESGDAVRLPPFAMPYLKKEAASRSTPLAVDLEFPAPPHPTDATSDATSNFYGNSAINFDGKSFPPARIIALDEDLLALYKPAGLPVQPGSAHSDSLSSRLAEYFKGAFFVPAPAHRLDRAASGLVLCGRSQSAQQHLHTLLAEESRYQEENPERTKEDDSGKKVGRVYLAWVSGKPQWNEETLLEDWLEKVYDSQSQRERMEASPVKGIKGGAPSGGAKLSRSLARTVLVKKMPTNIGDFSPSTQEFVPQECSLVLVRLLSGRKHQIRVQLASRGFPIIGDPKYGGPPYPRLLLHACALSLPDGRRFSLPPDWPSTWSVKDVDKLIDSCL